MPELGQKGGGLGCIFNFVLMKESKAKRTRPDLLTECKGNTPAVDVMGRLGLVPTKGLKK